MVRFVAYLQIMMMLSSPLALAGRLSPEVGAIGLKDWTKDEDLKHPYGVGFYLFQPVSDKVKLTIEYDYLTSKTRDWIYWNGGFTPDWERLQPEEVIRRNHVSSFQFGFRHLVTKTQTTSLEFGGGACLVHLEVDVRSRQGGRQWHFPDANKLGLVLDVGLLITDLKDLPLVMRFGFRHRFLTESGTGCCDCYSVFREAITTTELSWGFGYQFGRSKPASVDDGSTE